MAEVQQPSNEISTSHEEVEEDIANNNDPNNNADDLNVDEIPQNVCDILEETINHEISDIVTFFPGTEREDVRGRLETHWTNPLRQQVRNSKKELKLKDSC